MRAQRPVLIVKTGTTLAEIAARRGDFEDWICAGLGEDSPPVEVSAVYPDHEVGLPRPDSLAGVIVTGSSAMVSHAEPWSERTAEWLSTVVDAGTPCLGICYGHQLLAKALGGEVGPNPRGREIGTITVELSGAHEDPLLGVLGPKARVQASHAEAVLALPAAAKCRGTTSLDPHHVFTLPGRAWGVQFHPEFDAEVMRGYIRGRRQLLIDENLDPGALLEAVEETHSGSRLLARFGSLCASPEAATEA